MTAKVSSSKAAKRKADVLFSQLVRARGICVQCGETNPARMQTAHIISRRYSHTRCVPENAFAACSSCHLRWTEWPLEFAKFVLDTIGPEEYGRLFALSQQTGKVDWAAVVQELKALGGVE